MFKKYSSLLAAIAAVAVLAIAGPLAAQQPEADQAPTAKDPIRFRAFAVKMSAGASGTVQINIDRWTTDPEREALLKVVAVSTDKPGGQDKLLAALQNITPRTGYIRGSNTLGWDLKYAYQRTLPDGTRQIVVATDKPVSFFAAYSSARTMDYPFSLIEMRFKKGSDEGEGKLLGRTQISVKDGRLQLELYDTEPTRLTKITQLKDKDKDKD